MNKETLINKFLCLGASGKRGQNNSVGGFGIAKAAIFTGQFWQIWTNNLYFDSVMAYNDQDVRVNPDNENIHGTLIKVKLAGDNWSKYCIDDITKMIVYSDTKATLPIDDKIYGNDRIYKSWFLDSANKPPTTFYQNDHFKLSLLDAGGLKRKLYRTNGLVQGLSET